MSQVDQAGLQLLGWISHGVHMRSSSWFPRWEKAKDPRDKLILQIQETKSSNMVNHKNLNFCTYHSFGNSQSCITAVKWDAYDVENTAHNAGQGHPDCQSSCFQPCDWAEVFIWQNFQPIYRDLGWKNWDLGNRASLPSHLNTENFTKNLKVRQDLRNQASPGNWAHVKRP